MSGAERGQCSAGVAPRALTDIFLNGKTLLTGTGRYTTPFLEESLLKSVDVLHGLKIYKGEVGEKFIVEES